jgi:hypothetical protein
MGGKRPGAFALAFCLVFGLFFALPLPVSAASDDNSYTLVLEYDDAIQLTYEHEAHGYWETTTGDVPVGGAHLNSEAGPLVFGQVYCVDADVPFHSKIAGAPIPGAYTTSLGARTRDVVPNYAAVVPSKIPAIVGAHWRELEWVVMHGYQGDGDADAGRMYSDAYIPYPSALGAYAWDVAVMATKAAVWHFTNPGVSFVSTGFLARSGANPASPNGIKHRQFMALLDALIKGAEAYAAGATPLYTALQPYAIAIDDSAASFDSAGAAIIGKPANSPSSSANGVAYGPFYVRETSDQSGATRQRHEALLQLVSKSAPVSGVEFYGGNPDPLANPSAQPQPLAEYQAYGGTGPGDELPGITVSPAAPDSSDVPFWMYIPEDVFAANHVILDEDLLVGATITAVAKESISGIDDAAVKLPTVLVYQDPDTGEQNWNTIQAFVGAATAPLTQYAAAAIPYSTGGATGQLGVAKFAGQGSGPFKFQITYANGTPVYLDEAVNFSQFPLVPSPADAVVIDGQQGIFSLAENNTVAYITNLPLGEEYIITEFLDESYSTVSQIRIPPGLVTQGDGRTARFTLTSNSPSIEFYNDAVPFSLSVAKVSGVPVDNARGAPLQSVQFHLEMSAGGSYGYDEYKLTDPLGAAVFSVPLVEPWLAPFISPASLETITYTLTETDAPPNYSQLSGPIEIVVANGFVDSVTLSQEDKDMVSISGVGTSHLRLVIANAPNNPDGPGPRTGDGGVLLWTLQGGVAFVVMIFWGITLGLRRAGKKRG